MFNGNINMKNATIAKLIKLFVVVSVLLFTVKNINLVAEDKNENWKPIAIFAMSGQSNMSGAALSAELPKEYSKFPKNVRMWERETNSWVEIKLGEKFGPEVGFAFEMSKKMPKQNIGIVKVGISGAPISSWVGEDTDPKVKKAYEYGQAFEGWTTMIKKSLKASPDATLKCVFWMQGESDATKKELSEKYKNNLKKLIKGVRSEVAVENLPFFIGKIQAKKFTFLDNVVKAQEEVAKEVPHTFFVNTDGLELNSDDLHFSVKGQLDLGKLFAEEYLKSTMGKRQKTKR